MAVHPVQPVEGIFIRMEFFGLMFLAGTVLFGVLTFSGPANAIAKQMKRANDLKEAELRSQCVNAEKLSATQLARARHEPVVEIQRKLIERGYIEVKSGLHYFTDLGRSVGGEIRKNHPEASEGHMVWPANINL